MGIADNQEQARKATGSLLFYLFLGTLGVVGMVVLSVAGVLALVLPIFQMFTTDGQPPLNVPLVLLLVALTTGLLILTASLWKMRQLQKGGGEALAKSLGGRLIRQDTHIPIERRLLNVVEEVAIASMTTPPLVYLLDGEPGVNAFAAGLNEHQAVIGITRGAAELLKRDSLQALVAHEFSHILNGDMRLNLKLIGHVHGIVFLSLTGHVLLKASTNTVSNGPGDTEGFIPGVIAGAVLFAIGSIGGFCATLLKAAVGRQREFLADAAAVSYTRNPQALIQVLLTAGGCEQGTVLRTPRAPQASHLYFAAGLNTWLSRMLATHPPLKERILRIAPQYAGPLPEDAPVDEEAIRRVVQAQSLTEMAGFTRLTEIREGVVGEVIETMRVHQSHARKMLSRLPDRIIAAARSQHEAPALLCAMVLSRTEGKARRMTADTLFDRCDLPFHDLARELGLLLDSAPKAVWLPLLDTTHVTLIDLEADALEELVATLHALIGADRRISIFEWMLRKAMEQLLHNKYTPDAVKPPPPPPLPEECESARKKLASYATDCALLMYATAYWGDSAHETDAGARFLAGARACGLDTLQEPQQEAVTLQAVDKALTRLNSLPLLSKEMLLQACSQAISRAFGVPLLQGEFIRGAAVTLNCPPLPLLPGQK